MASILTLVLVRRLRDVIAAQVRRWWPDVRAALGALRASHKLALLVLGSLATELLFAIALGLFARELRLRHLARRAARDQHQRLAARQRRARSGRGRRGGVRAHPRAHVGGHDRGGRPSPPCSLYRIATFYLPPLWGFFALRWLQRNRYL